MWVKSAAVMHSAFWLLATLLVLTLETCGQPNSGADIQKNEQQSSKTVTKLDKHKEHGSDYNHKSSSNNGEAKTSGGHHKKHKVFKSKKFHKHTKTSHKHGHHKGKLPNSRKGRIEKGQKKGKKKKVHKKKSHHHKRTRTRKHKKHTRKHGKHGCKGKKIFIKEDPFCTDKTHKNHCRWLKIIFYTLIYPSNLSLLTLNIKGKILLANKKI